MKLVRPEEYTTAQQALADWDAGEIVWSVEMGGLGPGYEQCIQILIFELIRDQAGKPLPARGTTFGSWGDVTVDRLNPKLGFSGAQVGAAKSVAYTALSEGWAAMLAKVERKRLIQVQKEFPVIGARR